MTHPTSDRVVDGVRVVRVAEDPPHLEFTSDLVAWTLGLGHALVRAALPLLRDWHPDVVHAHDWLVAHAAIALRDLTGAPLVATIHATEAGRHGGWLSAPLNRQVHSVEWWLANAADALVTCSHAMRDEVAGLFDVDPDRVTVLHNGIDASGWSARSSRGAPLTSDVSTAPRSHRLADARDVRPAGVGEGHPGRHRRAPRDPTRPPRDAADGGRHRLARRRGWPERARAARVRRAVTMLGHVDDAALVDLLGRASAVVLPSRYEPFGIVALEAAAAGAPLVASRAGGLGEVVLDGITGLSFDPGDVAGCAAAVIAALDAPDAAHRRAVAARERLATDFAWPAIAADTAALYARTHRRDLERRWAGPIRRATCSAAADRRGPSPRHDRRPRTWPAALTAWARPASSRVNVSWTGGGRHPRRTSADERRRCTRPRREHRVLGVGLAAGAEHRVAGRDVPDAVTDLVHDPGRVPADPRRQLERHDVAQEPATSPPGRSRPPPAPPRGSPRPGVGLVHLGDGEDLGAAVLVEARCPHGCDLPSSVWPPTIRRRGRRSPAATAISRRNRHRPGPRRCFSTPPGEQEVTPG